MKKSIKILWKVFFFSILAVILIFIGANFGLFGKMPSMQQLENPEADLASEIYSADGVLMGKIYKENRSEVKYSQIAESAVHALVATEDDRFYEHSGIDAEAVGRAIFSLGRDGGGSTITQQLAKMILKQGGGNKSKFQRSFEKIKEWIVAVKLERNFTKDEIITLYLNRAAWGNVYGIRNASRTYFKKEPDSLKLEESAVLIGMLKGFKYEPVKHPNEALFRRNTVINQMVLSKHKYLTPQEGVTLKAKPLVTNYSPIDEAIGIAPYFRKELVSYIKDWAANTKNAKTGEYYDVYSDGLKIYTTIDSKMQALAEAAVAAHVPVVQKKLNGTLQYFGDRIWRGRENVLMNAAKQSSRWINMTDDGFDSTAIMKTFYIPTKMKIFSWRNKDTHEIDTVMTPMDSIKYHKKLLQTSFAAVDPRSGEVKAWVGGTDYKWFKYDHVTAKRQVGSTFKPLLYTLAVTDAGYTPETYIQGGSVTMSGKTIGFSGGSMANCLAMSVNGAAWRLMQVVGVKRTVEFAHECGIKANVPNYPSIALGAAEIPLIEMLQSYSMFPNRGYNTPLVYVTRIEDKAGNLIHEFPLAQSKQVISESDNYAMVKMMQGVIARGTARRLNGYNIPVEKAGKTGTTNGNTDGWFIGYTPTLLAGVWVGCDDPFIPIYQGNAGGSEMAAPEWGNFMEAFYNNKNFKNYTTIKNFNVPVQLQNDPIYADARFESALNNGVQSEQVDDDFTNFGSDSVSTTSDDFFDHTDEKKPTEVIEKKDEPVKPQPTQPNKKIEATLEQDKNLKNKPKK